VKSFQGGRKTVFVGEADACGEVPLDQYLAVALYPQRVYARAVNPGVLIDEDFRVLYHRSITCLGELGNPAVVLPILRNVDIRLHPYRVEDLLSVLVRVGPSAAGDAAGELASLSIPTRHLSALSLAYLGATAAREKLVAALSSDDGKPLEAASFVLPELIVAGALDEAEAFAVLSRLVYSIDPRVRRNAMRTLILFDHTGPAGDLLKEGLRDTDQTVVQTAHDIRNALRAATAKKYFAIDLDGAWSPAARDSTDEQ
jgi:hypothetical protein